MTENSYKTFLAALLLAFPVGSMAAAGGPELMPFQPDVGNTASVQRGARNFVNYCLGCHSMKYVRYKTMGQDLHLTEDQVVDNLMFTGEKPHDHMNIAMDPGDSERWFGRTPPDASLLARSRGPQWIYSYLKGYYVDPERALGVNNLYLKGVSMPHVLAELEGTKRAVFAQTEDADGVSHEAFSHFEPVTAGSMTAVEYDRFVGDLVNFMVYAGEPKQLERQRWGVYVMLFLVIFFIFTYLLKQEYWKDVH